MMTLAAVQFIGLSWLMAAWAFSRHSVKTSGGIIFSARAEQHPGEPGQGHPDTPRREPGLESGLWG